MFKTISGTTDILQSRRDVSASGEILEWFKSGVLGLETIYIYTDTLTDVICITMMQTEIFLFILVLGV
ncbi:unnamed protein product [Callosobruchus maculatus]|uniref:Uncharacterized protein n=1 Tax=Callosobruchus maculatus TaxID=64391 RepID=A0A653C6Y3_CALMS|nr:unnamed protein product [Callosobruchus maculatus]